MVCWTAFSLRYLLNAIIFIIQTAHCQKKIRYSRSRRFSRCRGRVHILAEYDPHDLNRLYYGCTVLSWYRCWSWFYNNIKPRITWTDARWNGQRPISIIFLPIPNLSTSAQNHHAIKSLKVRFYDPGNVQQIQLFPISKPIYKPR